MKTALIEWEAEIAVAYAKKCNLIVLKWIWKDKGVFK